MKQQSPASKKSIDEYLQTLIKESIKSTLQRKALQEKEKQDDLSGSSSSESSDSEHDKLKKGEIESDDIINKLNAIRSGRSFKDPAISDKLNSYIDDLTKAEKTALLAFLKGISQVVTGEFDPYKAMEPEDKPASVKMKKSGAVQKKSIKPTVIKAPSIEKKQEKSSEDTSGPVPIKPKK